MLQRYMRSALQPMRVENGRCLACLPGLLRCMLLSCATGAADGTITAWSLSHDVPGAHLFTVTAHSGAVMQLKAMPPDAGASCSSIPSQCFHALLHLPVGGTSTTPCGLFVATGTWQDCILSSGPDGVVCIMSMVLGRCERMLPGKTAGSSVQYSDKRASASRKALRSYTVITGV
jgi:hypothetical protein